MKRNPMRRSWRKPVVAAVALALVAAACGGDDDDDDAEPAGAADAEDTAADEPDADADADADAMEFAGAEVTILGPERGVEADGFVNAFAPLEERTGIEIVYTGTADATTELNLAIEAGDPPDITMIPQPGRILGFAEEGLLVPMGGAVLETISSSFDPVWADLVTLDGEVYGVPNKSDVKSLVFYNTALFNDNGYTVPTTWDEMVALMDTMKTDGVTPLCVTIGSGDATGWPFTDWMEDFMLRIHGPDVYDQWVNHEIPFNDPKVKEVVEFVSDIWFTEGNVLGGRDVIASTDFKENAAPLVNGDCAMHRQANFFASNIVELGAEIGPEGSINIFYLPTISDEFGRTLLSAGNYAVAFSNDPAVQEVMNYMASAEYANTRLQQDIGGYISANIHVDPANYHIPLERELGGFFAAADVVRFDASDLMPGEVGGGEWWRSGTDYVSGSITLDEFLDNTEAAWPS